MLRDRLEGTGQLTTKTATDLGVLGYVARASGVNVDVRRDHPFAAYDRLKFNVPVFESGDVYARTMVRVEEARESVALIKQAMARMAGGPLAARSAGCPRLSRHLGLWKAGAAPSCTG